MADPSLESFLQINKDGIRNNAYLEREIAETFCRKHSIDLQGTNIIMLEKKLWLSWARISSSNVQINWVRWGAIVV